MNGRQWSKGYNKRAQHKKKDEPNDRITKLKQKDKKRKGVAKMRNHSQLESEIRVLTDDLQLERQQTRMYKEAWQAEKSISLAWRKRNEELQQQVRRMGQKNLIVILTVAATIVVHMALSVLLR